MNIAAAISLFGTATGFVFGAIWWRMARAPGWHTMRWFAGIAFTAAGYCFFDAISVFEIPPAFTRFTTQMAFSSGAMHAYMWVQWFAGSANRPPDRAERITMSLALFFAGAGLVPGLLVSATPSQFTLDLIGVTYRAYLPNALGMTAYLFFLVTLMSVAARAYLRPTGDRYAQLAAGTLVLLIVLAISDTLATAQLIRMPMLIDLGFLLTILIFGLESLGRFARDAEQLESLTHHLEDVVTARTAELEAAQHELARERTVAAVGRLAGGVSHEINNPATVISVNVGLLRDDLAERGELHGAVRELLDEIRNALHRIIEIVTDLRLSSGTVEPVGGTRTESVLRLCIDRALAQAAERGAPTVVTRIDVPDALRVRGDRVSVTRLITELVSNACEAAAAAHPAEGRVHLTATESREGIELGVTDNGAGITPVVRNALFEPFTGGRGDASRGLGLAVVRGLAEQLGATLRVEDAPGGGARFLVLFALPRR